VRTSSEATTNRHRFLLIDMKSPGVSVRPIVLLDGERSTKSGSTTSEVPAENLVGEENKG
jgi:alkylation response protein AidB-like acyl-CoA dehydrogenase